MRKAKTLVWVKIKLVVHKNYKAVLIIKCVCVEILLILCIIQMLETMFSRIIPEKLGSLVEFLK